MTPGVPTQESKYYECVSGLKLIDFLALQIQGVWRLGAYEVLGVIAIH